MGNAVFQVGFTGSLKPKVVVKFSKVLLGADLNVDDIKIAIGFFNGFCHHYLAVDHLSDGQDAVTTRPILASA